MLDHISTPASRNTYCQHRPPGSPRQRCVCPCLRTCAHCTHCTCTRPHTRYQERVGGRERGRQSLRRDVDSDHIGLGCSSMAHACCRRQHRPLPPVRAWLASLAPLAWCWPGGPRRLYHGRHHRCGRKLATLWRRAEGDIYIHTYLSIPGGESLQEGAGLSGAPQSGGEWL